jgi:hypothetical protein
MVKTQIQVEEWQYEALKKESARTSRSMSDFIREAVSMALKRPGGLRPLEECAGRYRPLQEGDDLKSHDAAWIETIR